MFAPLINAEDLQASLHAAPWLIFDVRHDLADHQAGRRAYDEGHIPGARYLDHEVQLSAPRTGLNGRHPLPYLPDFAALMRAHGLTAQSRVVAYDGSGGVFATHLWWMLRWLGHDKVAVLDGGWPAWLANGGEVETTRPDALSLVQEAQREGTGAALSDANAGGSEGEVGLSHLSASMPTVDASRVLENIDSTAFTVVDARAADRYRGEIEPMDPVAGHIPGALNRPHGLNLLADGRFKPAAQLRQEFKELLGDASPAQVVHQCGSGITASHNLFAMELAGLHGSALYPGSWSEWCSDAARPVALGDQPR